MLLFSININCVFINHSVIYENHIVVSINHTVVYRNLHGKNTFLRVTIQENYSFLYVISRSFFLTSCGWFSVEGLRFFRTTFKQYLNAV